MPRTPLLPGLLALVGLFGCEGGPAAPAPGPAPPPPRVGRAPSAGARTVLWIGGDVLLSGAIRRSVRADGDAADGFATLLSPVAERWRAEEGATLVLVNLESPVAQQRNDNDAHRHEKRGNRLVRVPLNAPAWLLDGLARADVDAVMLANNHALDQEREGLAETLDAAHGAGLITTGAGRSPDLSWPVVLGDEGARLAVLTFFEKDFPEPALPAGEAGLSVLGPESAARVRRAKEESDAVVVVVHVVAELFDEVKPRWRQWAAELASAGADAIAVHGAHVPAPVETIRVGDREVPVAFGLGNMVSDMGSSASPEREPPEEPTKWEDPETREGLLMRVEVGPEGVEARLLPIFMSQTRWLVANRALPGPPRFSLLPLAACGPAARLPEDWPEPWRGEMLAWISSRRDHLLSVTGLRAPECEEGEISLLAPPPPRDTM